MSTFSTSAGKAVTGVPGGRLYDAAELATWVAGLTLLVSAFTLAGGVIFGLAPALIAGAQLSRARLRGDQQPMITTFARSWRRELVRANLMLAPIGAAGLLLTVNLALFSSAGGPLVAALWAALALVVVAGVVTITMYAHYELPLRRYPVVAVRYLLHDPPAAALVAVTTALAVAGVWFVPGLAVLAVGAWLHAVTALCLSFFTRNDQLVAATTPTETSAPSLATKGQS
jgi:uncharacterized membrane protein YesL